MTVQLHRTETILKQSIFVTKYDPKEARIPGLARNSFKHPLLDLCSLKS